jgi:hypothetical protein
MAYCEDAAKPTPIGAIRWKPKAALERLALAARDVFEIAIRRAIVEFDRGTGFPLSRQA